MLKWGRGTTEPKEAGLHPQLQSCPEGPLSRILMLVILNSYPYSTSLPASCREILQHYVLLWSYLQMSFYLHVPVVVQSIS